MLLLPLVNSHMTYADPKGMFVLMPVELLTFRNTILTVNREQYLQFLALHSRVALIVPLSVQHSQAFI